jgi:hypothetical protein
VGTVVLDPLQGLGRNVADQPLHRQNCSYAEIYASLIPKTLAFL